MDCFVSLNLIISDGKVPWEIYSCMLPTGPCTASGLGSWEESTDLTDAVVVVEEEEETLSLPSF